MTNPHDPVSFPTDPHPVRPGTSDALFARTIDATPQPPLVRAQETVATAIPRLTASLSDPLFLVTLTATLVLLWLAVRMRSQLRPVLLSAMLLITLTSFRPVQRPDEVPVVDDQMIARGYERARRFERRQPPLPPTPEPTPFVYRVPARPDLRQDFERIWQDEELQAAIEELRLRIEAELRRRGERRYHDMRSARWIRRLPPSLREWVVVGQQTVAAWDRNP